MVNVQNARMDKLENHLMELKTSTSKIEASNTDIDKSMTFLSDQLTSIETKITGLEKERNSMSIKLTALEEKVESLDRSIVKTCVELRNIPKQSKETKKMLYTSLLKLSNYIEMDLQSSDIREVLRQPSKKDSTTSSLTVEFTNTLLKSEFLTAIKEYNRRNPNNKINSSHLGYEKPTTPIYVAEQLTAYSKRLFYLARTYAKANEYSYCWTSEGRILLKKNPESPSIVIRSEQQLNSLSTPKVI
ncbi:hypothetical protein PYW07_014973 [Mythimna separata]|uniref:FP protein C-terminal domain-containing protein n=1 Tax=Mythimna separata TaxID=271217 RepID=A0AAD7YXP0_MYTSE|nr:hypothetical protein PYW07_014973 [Mythimna separata]